METAGAGPGGGALGPALAGLDLSPALHIFRPFICSRLETDAGIQELLLIWDFISFKSSPAWRWRLQLSSHQLKFNQTSGQSVTEKASS